MEQKMFCYQCEQTAGCSGCNRRSNCSGKKMQQVAALQDELTGRSDRSGKSLWKPPENRKKHRPHHHRRIIYNCHKCEF